MNASLLETFEPYTLLRVSLALFEKNPAELDAQQIKQAQRQAVNEYNLETRVLNSPEALGVMVPQQELDHALAQVQERFEDEIEFESHLSLHGLTLDTMKAALRRQFRVDSVLESIAAHAPKVNEVEIALYYHSHPEKFYHPEQRIARHILISINDDYVENSRENAYQTIQEIAQKLQRKAHKFPDLALKHSECPTALNGGELGTLEKGILYSELDAALFLLKENEISGIVETEMGFHVIQCTKIIPAKTMSLQKAIPKIRSVMQERQRRLCQKSWLASLSAANAAQSE